MELKKGINTTSILVTAHRLKTSLIWKNIYIYIVKQQDENKIHVDKNMLCTNSRRV